MLLPSCFAPCRSPCSSLRLPRMASSERRSAESSTLLLSSYDVARSVSLSTLLHRSFSVKIRALLRKLNNFFSNSSFPYRPCQRDHHPKRSSSCLPLSRSLPLFFVIELTRRVLSFSCSPQGRWSSRQGLSLHPRRDQETDIAPPWVVTCSYSPHLCASLFFLLLANRADRALFLPARSLQERTRRS